MGHDPINLLFPILSLKINLQSWEILTVIYYINNNDFSVNKNIVDDSMYYIDSRRYSSIFLTIYRLILILLILLRGSFSKPKTYVIFFVNGIDISLLSFPISRRHAMPFLFVVSPKNAELITRPTWRCKHHLLRRLCVSVCLGFCFCLLITAT